LRSVSSGSKLRELRMIRKKRREVKEDKEAGAEQVTEKG